MGNQVKWFDPPLTIPGMISVLTDTTGRLIEFNAVPPETTENKSEAAKVDWNKFFVEAGLDFNKFEPTEPNWRPRFGYDERTAWKGTMADWADIPIRIEAASFEGKPVYFRVVAPWDEKPQAFIAPEIARFLSW